MVSEAPKLLQFLFFFFLSTWKVLADNVIKHQNEVSYIQMLLQAVHLLVSVRMFSVCINIHTYIFVYQCVSVGTFEE